MVTIAGAAERAGRAALAKAGVEADVPGFRV